MLGEFASTMLTALVRQGASAGARPVGSVPTALIGSGVTLLMKRGQRGVGVVLLAAGAALVWRETRKAAAAEPRVTARRADGQDRARLAMGTA